MAVKKPKKMPKSKIKQTARERMLNAIGKESAIVGRGEKGMREQRSFTSRDRARIKSEARKLFNEGQITEKRYKQIVDNIDGANAMEVQAMSNTLSNAARSRAMKDKVSLKDALPKLKTEREPKKGPKRPTEMTKEELKAAVEAEDAAMAAARKKAQKRSKGGAVKGYNVGGAVSRKGSFDYRKGGLFK